MTSDVIIAIIYHMDNQPISPYENPENIADSHGDRLLLDRIVARAIASTLREESTDETERFKADQQFQIMDEEVKRRRQELGLPEEQEPSEPQ